MIHERQATEAQGNATLARLTGDATGLGQQVVEIGAFLHDLDRRCRAQADTLAAMQAESRRIARSADEMVTAVARMTRGADEALNEVQRSTALLAESGSASRDLAAWVRSVHADGAKVEDMLRAVQISTAQISDIAAQVTILAVNAKIEAARAGQAGKGFAIVADAVNDLSHKTADAADRISVTLRMLTEWIAALQGGAERTVQGAEIVLSRSAETDGALTEIERRMDMLGTDAHGLAAESARTIDALGSLLPASEDVARSVGAVARGVDEASRRCDRLVDASETILQGAVALGGNGADGPMIALAQDVADRIAAAFSDALERGDISSGALFDTQYLPVPGTDPVQVTTGFTSLADRLLPGLQEPVLAMDPRIVFCAAVDRNGYLPTHNRIFSQPQGADPVWNAAHCRNRRIFDDRVGLKAGRNERPFLLQVYRRDMGGGQFVLMKDVSAPIRVRGRHWGGLRLAYRF